MNKGGCSELSMPSNSVLNLDIIGVAESHLIGDNTLDIPGYEWLSHIRKDISVWAKVLGSGGVGLFVAERQLERFTF